MPKFGQKKSLETLLFNKLTLLILVIIALFLTQSVYERYQVERDMADRREVVEAEYAALEERRASLVEQVEYLEGDSGRESEIRQNFDVAREGEQVVIIVEDEALPVEANVGIDPLVAPSEPWYKFW